MNDTPAPAQTDAERLTDHILAIEEMEARKKAVSEDIKARYATAKAQGFDPSVMRNTIKRRADAPLADAKDRTSATYLHAVTSTLAIRAQSEAGTGPQPPETPPGDQP